MPLGRIRRVTDFRHCGLLHRPGCATDAHAAPLRCRGCSPFSRCQSRNRYRARRSCRWACMELRHWQHSRAQRVVQELGVSPRIRGSALAVVRGRAFRFGIPPHPRGSHERRREHLTMCSSRPPRKLRVLSKHRRAAAA